jgi:class 3 adenylate cyclase
VYTDVKGSTTQWEMHPPVMEKALAMHNDIMRARIQQHNGYEVRTILLFSLRIFSPFPYLYFR